MKNYTVKIIAIIALIAAMTSCTNVSADMTNEPAATVKTPEAGIAAAETEVPAEIAEPETPAQVEPVAAEAAPIPEGMQRITRVYSVIHEGLNTGLTSIGRNVTLTMDIPDFLVASDGNGNCTEYLRPYGENGTDHQRCFGLSALSRVSQGFAFDGTEYDTSAIPGVWNPFEGREIHLGKTDAGTEYAIYGGGTDSFYGHVLVRASDEYVAEFTMSTNSAEETALLEKMIDSVTVAVDDTVYDGVPEGMKKISYSCPNADVNSMGYSFEDHTSDGYVTVSMNAPEDMMYVYYLTHSDSVNDDICGVSPCFESGRVFEVESGFKFTGTINGTDHTDGERNPYEGADVTVGTTPNGRSYEIYQRDFDECSWALVYALVDDKYVVSFAYTDPEGSLGMIEEMIDSVSVKIS